MRNLLTIASLILNLALQAQVLTPTEKEFSLETKKKNINPEVCLEVSDALCRPTYKINNNNTDNYKFKPLQLIVPAAMIGVGIIGLESHWIIRRNHEMREELQESGHGKFTTDDFTQFAPMVAVYGLNLGGLKGLHNFGERTIIMVTATLLTLSSVYTIKSTSNIERPDGTAFNSFPSGHTAIAFMGAECLRREYWKASP